MNTEAVRPGGLPNVAGVAKKRIGEALKEARVGARLSARDLERSSGLATGVISQIESGKRKDPGFGTVLRLARAIGVTMQDLAQAVEGKASGPARDDGASARALAAIGKAQTELAKAAGRLEGAAKALGQSKRVRR